MMAVARGVDHQVAEFRAGLPHFNFVHGSTGVRSEYEAGFSGLGPGASVRSPEVVARAFQASQQPFYHRAANFQGGRSGPTSAHQPT